MGGDSPPYIAMAHAPGRRPSEVAAVGVKLAEVLAVMHARGVLHRDINGNNVLIDERGAVTLTPPEARVVIPHGGIGALAWSAPEVRAGRGWKERGPGGRQGHE